VVDGEVEGSREVEGTRARVGEKRARRGRSAPESKRDESDEQALTSLHQIAHGGHPGRSQRPPG
jgi:hypothetical protein